MRYLIILLALSACATVEQENNNVATSMTYLDLHEVKDREYLTQFLGVDPAEVEWCAAFVNAVLKENGYSTSASVHDHPLLARSFTYYGTKVSEPRQGDIVVLKRGTESWQGHVGFYLRTEVKDGVPHYVLISGNDRNSVTINSFPVSRVVAVRRPGL